MANQVKVDLASWLEEWCQKERLSLRQAAAKTGLSHCTIAGIMKGCRPSAETVRKLAQAFGGNGHLGLALEDKLLVLAGYRTPRSEEDKPTELLAQLLDKLSQFSEPQLGMVRHFADFISEMEEK